jgi:hypothetical protein
VPFPNASSRRTVVCRINPQRALIVRDTICRNQANLVWAAVIIALVLLAGVLSPGTARGDIFVSSFDGRVGAYTNSGGVVNASLLSGLSVPYGIAVSGSDMYIAENGKQRIGKYTISGTTINASLINFVDPIGLTLFGSNLYVANTGQAPNSDWVSVYTTSGTPVGGHGGFGVSE